MNDEICGSVHDLQERRSRLDHTLKSSKKASKYPFRVFALFCSFLLLPLFHRLFHCFAFIILLCRSLKILSLTSLYAFPFPPPFTLDILPPPLLDPLFIPYPRLLSSKPVDLPPSLLLSLLLFNPNQLLPRQHLRPRLESFGSKRRQDSTEHKPFMLACSPPRLDGNDVTGSQGRVGVVGQDCCGSCVGFA